MTPFFVEEIGEALDGVEVIVSGVNAHGMHWIGQTPGPHLWPGRLIIAMTRGLEAVPNGDPRILPDVLVADGSIKDIPMARAIVAGETLESAAIVRAIAEMPPTLEARGIVGLHGFPLLHPDRHRWGTGSHSGAAVQHDPDRIPARCVVQCVRR
ncbi:MAG: hypothetical protein KatS3mg058_0187 [Roseiflexus sp.]|nr:MAG: hypothetical protein KatS3mg058_0187 [Roseiflexus sp.]